MSEMQGKKYSNSKRPDLFAQRAALVMSLFVCVLRVLMCAYMQCRAQDHFDHKRLALRKQSASCG